MTHAVRFVAVVAVLTALALCVPVQAQTPEQTDALRARAEAGDVVAQNNLGVRYGTGEGPVALALESPAVRLGYATWAA